MMLDDDVLPPISWENGGSLPNQDPKTLRELTQLFVERLPEEKILLEKLFNQQDWKMLAEESHRMFGCSCYFGVPAICKAFEQLEKSAISENSHAIESAFRSFCYQYERLLDAAQRLCTVS